MKQPTEQDQLSLNLQHWAEGYANKSGGAMTVLPYDPELYQAQAADCVSVDGKPQDIGIIDTVAGVAQANYAALVDDLHTNEATTQRLAMVGELLEDGNNVIVSTNHGDLIDVAVVHAAVYTELVRQGFQPKTGIVISKMISYLAYKLGDEFTPCVNALEILEDHTFLSYPRTDSSKRHLKDRLFPPEAERHNKQFKKAVGQALGEGSLLLAMAASGTTDKPVEGDSTAVTMGTLGHGTMDILATERTYTLPIGVWYTGEHRILCPVDIPRRVTTEEKAHAMMQTIATTLTETTGDTTFVYNKPEPSN